MTVSNGSTVNHAFTATALQPEDGYSTVVRILPKNSSFNTVTLQFDQAITTATITCQTPTTDIAPNNLVIQGGTPFASATTNKTPGNLIFNCPAPLAGGSHSHISVQDSGVTYLQLLNDGTNAQINFQSGAPAPLWQQQAAAATTGGGAAGQTSKIASQAGQGTTDNSTAGAGGNLTLTSGSGGTSSGGGSAGAVGLLRLECGGTIVSQFGQTSSDFVSLGAATTASAGLIRVPNNQVILKALNASAADITLIQTDSSNNVIIGESTNDAALFLRSHGNLNIQQGTTTLWSFSSNQVSIASTVSNPSIQQNSTSAGSGSSLTISAQNATGASNNGGNLNLAAGTSGSATAGVVHLQTAGSTQLTVGATGVITIANLGTGLVHADSSGNLTSSTLVNADIAAAGTANIAVAKLSTGTANQILTTDGTTPNWNTTLAGNYSFSGTPTFSNALSMPNGTTGTTQTVNDNSTKLATTAYVDQLIAGGGVVMLEDFLGTTSNAAITTATGFACDGQWGTAQISGGTQTINAQASTFQNPGQIIFTTSATSGQGVSLYKHGGNGTFGAMGGNGGWVSNIWFQTPATITSFCFRVGFCKGAQQVADAPNSGFWLEYDTANTGNSDTKMAFRTVSGGTPSYDTTANITPVASTFYHVQITGVSSGHISYAIGTANGALGAATTVTSNINTTDVMTAFIHCITRTTATRSLVMDKFTLTAGTGRV